MMLFHDDDDDDDDDKVDNDDAMSMMTIMMMMMTMMETIMMMTPNIFFVFIPFPLIVYNLLIYVSVCLVTLASLASLILQIQHVKN